MRLISPASTTSAEATTPSSTASPVPDAIRPITTATTTTASPPSVEREHRAPRRVPLEHHLLARMQVHAAERYSLPLRPPHELVFASMDRAWLATQTRRGPLDRVARPRGGPRQHGRVLGQQARPRRRMGLHATRRSTRDARRARRQGRASRSPRSRPSSPRCGTGAPPRRHRAAEPDGRAARARCDARGDAHGGRVVAATASAARCAAARRSRAGAGGSSGSSSRRRAARARAAATPAASPRCTSIISIRRRRRSRWLPAAWRERSTPHAWRPGSACCCARTATRRLKRSGLPVR